jgi:hypothetical protein
MATGFFIEHGQKYGTPPSLGPKWEDRPDPHRTLKSMEEKGNHPKEKIQTVAILN